MRILILLTVLLAGLVACGGGDDDAAQPASAEDALVRQLDQLSKGQYGPLWDTLHPEQQKLISRDHYIECVSGSGIEITHVDVKETYEEETTIPGTSVRTATTALTTEYTAKSGLLESTETETFHEVMVDGKWRWALATPEDYANGNCP